MMPLPPKPRWMDDALCAQTDFDIFFPPKSDNAAAQTAKNVCAKCPVRAACLEYAVAAGERGVWGGTTDRQRSRIRREREEAAA